MTLQPDLTERLRFLVRVADKEARHLTETTERLFDTPFTTERAESLATNPDIAERVDAFVSRFGRLQDTLGDKQSKAAPALRNDSEMTATLPSA